ncbi:merozoite surface protein 3b [Pseudomonas sp. NPDC089569]|uniref:merozoite surface protein 3b n=1 Tax=Pseudomonas sp. NPDC089569 TaxID=3390722 RepID=UPI003CFFC386
MTPSTINYLERAKAGLAAIGINVTGTVESAPILSLLERVQHYDKDKVIAIAATLQQSSSFHQTVREQLKGLDSSALYQSITDDFDSIRTDSTKMAEWMADGKLDLFERAQMMFIKIRRGSIPERFASIQQNYLSSVKIIGKEIEREEIIREAYHSYQMAMKQSEILAQEVLKLATETLEARRSELQACNEAVEANLGGDSIKLSALELARDEALRAFQMEDKSYQIAKDIAEDQKTGYNTSKVVFAQLEQVSLVKDRLHQRMISFFSGQEGVLTALSAAFTAKSGLNSAANVLRAQKEGIEKSIEALARSTGGDVRDAIGLAYGASLDAAPVKQLAEAIVQLQSDMAGLIESARTKATKCANEIESATTENERAFAALVAKAS